MAGSFIRRRSAPIGSEDPIAGMATDDQGMERVACNLCGSTQHRQVYRVPDRRYFPDRWFNVVECRQCGLGFVNPRPRFDEMAPYYPPVYYEEEFVQNARFHRKRYALEALYLREFEGRSQPPRLLDIGCANGDFPRFMAGRGWIVEGVEVSSATTPIRDFKVYNQPFPEIPVDTPTYDAVTAWAVLEHVHDPMAHFAKASKVLQPGGLLVFLVTNFESLASRYLFGEDVPRHLFFFTRNTVKSYLQRTGFRLEREDNDRNIYQTPPQNWIYFLLRTRLRGKPLTWEDLPPSRPEFIRQHGLRPGFASSVRFAWHYPLRVLDRALWPVLERIQVLRRTYPVSTYVARRLEGR